MLCQNLIESFVLLIGTFIDLVILYSMQLNYAKPKLVTLKLKNNIYE